MVDRVVINFIQRENQHKQMLSLALENPNKVNISITIEEVLRTMFAGYRRLIIKKEFGHGLSGSRVFEVKPIQADGTPELATVVKLATISLIQKEWQAYRQHIHRRLPYVAEIRSEPTLLPEIGRGGLRYTLVGGSTFEVISLRDHLRRVDLRADDIQLTLQRLFRIMHHIWGFQYPTPQFCLAANYDQLLPVNLLVQHQPDSTAQQPPIPIIPGRLPEKALKVGQRVLISGFALSKVNPATQTMTLKRPSSSKIGPAYYLRCKSALVDTLSSYPLNHIIDSLEGRVIETRNSRLRYEIEQIYGPDFNLSAATLSMPSYETVTLPNPLPRLAKLLNETRPVYVASIHGDFNMENILIEAETGQVSLIDFAEARTDHVLHDLLRLETEIITKVVPEILQRQQLPPDLTMAALYQQLHQSSLQSHDRPPKLPHPDLSMVWVMLKLIRQTARQYLYDPEDLSEYYHCLTLYLLGALKFKNLNTLPQHPLPKQAAFWAAVLAYQALESPTDILDLPLPSLTTIPSFPAGNSVPVFSQKQAEQKLSSLPLEIIPVVAPLPAKSRMPLGRNPLFVGREQGLKGLAKKLKGGQTVASGQVETAAATGLGGMGKTQLVSEFVHRYGQFFGGGVFWLSFADPKAIPAEIARCGGAGAMELRPNFGELPLEDQVKLVIAEWQNSVPRLLVFDNCEEPDLLAQWRPSSGGCRVLVTSRRADWEPGLNVQSLVLDVLQRSESMALLREHQSDAEDAILDAVAAELGDLPLALHLAGSYLARYRRVMTPAQYLEQLRDPKLLKHPSLKGSGISPTGHIQNVYRTIALSYDKLNPNDSIGN